MSVAELSPQLEQRLRDADAAALAVGPAGEPTEDQLVTLADNHALVDRFLDDVREALKQVFVAGLAFPDPELPEELAALARRARRHGLAVGLRHLLRLRAWLVQLGDDETLDVDRPALVAGAFAETQRIVAWLRLFRTEHDFLVVQGRLAGRTEGRAKAKPKFDTLSASLWCHGIELTSGGKVLFYCRDLDDEITAVLVDELAEFDPNNPVGGGAISRLFQDRIVLDEVTRSVIRLEDHPFVDKDGVRIVRPAFNAVPRILGVASTFEPPPLKEAELNEAGVPDLKGWTQGLRRLPVTIERQGQRILLRTADDAPPNIPVTPLLRFNLSKFLMREGRSRVGAELIVWPRTREVSLVAMRGAYDGQVFPAQDTRLFTLHPTVLAKRASSDPVPANTLHGAWIRTATYLFGGAKRDDITALRDTVRALQPHGLHQHYRAGLLRFFLGVHAMEDPLPVQSLVTDALALAAGGTDLHALARVLDVQQASAADLHLVDGQLIYEALWLAMLEDLIDPLIGTIDAVYQKRYAGNIRDPSTADVCCKALLTAIDGRGEELADLDDLDEDELLEDAGAFHHEAALHFLDAWLVDLRKRGGGKKQKPLPEPIELLQLADTRAVLSSANRHGATVKALSIPTGRLRTALLDRVYPWLVDHATTTRRKARVDAGDALFVIASSGLKRSFVG